MSAALDALVRKHPELAVASSILRTLATALPEVALPAGVPNLTVAQARLAAGIPALEGEPLLSGAALLANVRVLCAALGATMSTAGLVSETLEHGLHPTEMDQLAAAAQSGAWGMVKELAGRLDVDPDTVITLVDHVARPALRAGARMVLPLVMQHHWGKGTCPACGTSPLLAELRGGGASGGAEQERVMRCARCLGHWVFPRLRCVVCGETNHRRLAYLHGEGEGAFRRADVCSTCNSYLKCVTVLAPLSLVELLGMDLATCALDLAAVERGFHRA